MNCQFVTLEQDALLHITGPDALTFLQGQTTCDTRNVDAGHALPGAFCTAQGRVVCDFLLCQLDDEHFALRMRRGIRQASSQAFGKYIIFSKADLADDREDWLPVGIWGAEAAAAVQSVFTALPAQRFDAISGEGFVLVRLDDQGTQFECYLEQASSDAWLSRMKESMQVGLESQWQAGQIACGTARIEEATVGEFVPQTLNYDLTGHISFTKGCYTGQEVVARLHYKGTPKRRSHFVSLPTDTECPPNTPTFDSVTGKSVGHIVNAAATESGTAALVAATAEGVSNGLRLGSTEGPALTPGELPYSLLDD